MMRSWANYLAPHNIRVNAVAPTGVSTPMTVNEHLAQLFEQEPGIAAGMQNALPVEMVDAIDISNAILWLVSDAARYVKTLRESGQLAAAGEQQPATGLTHQIERDEQGRQVLRRKRFSIR